MTPFWCLAAGSGLVALGHWIMPVESAPSHRLRLLRLLAVALTTGVLAAAQVRWIASEERQLVTYSDPRTLAAWDLGWRLSQAPVGQEPRILFAGAPAMFADGFANLRFLAQGIPMTDVESPLAPDGKAPALDPESILIIIAERSAERCAAEQAYPDATIAEVRRGMAPCCTWRSSGNRCAGYRPRPRRRNPPSRSCRRPYVTQVDAI
jgi:hypothetical protein